MIYIITGTRNEGKTKTQKLILSILRNKSDKAQQFSGLQIDIDGFICSKCFLRQPLLVPVEYDENNQETNNHHIGYDLIRVSDQTSVPFIRLMEYADPDSGKGFHYGPFIFFKKGIDAGKQILQECYVRKTKNVIIDEVGKLELDGQVFADELQELTEYSDNVNLFISVRTEFLEAVVEKFGIDNFIEIQANFPEKKIEEILEDIT